MFSSLRFLNGKHLPLGRISLHSRSLDSISIFGGICLRGLILFLFDLSRSGDFLFLFDLSRSGDFLFLFDLSRSGDILFRFDLSRSGVLLFLFCLIRNGGLLLYKRLFRLMYLNLLRHNLNLLDALGFLKGFVGF
jgi:hypothetical protein